MPNESTPGKERKALGRAKSIAPKRVKRIMRRLEVCSANECPHGDKCSFSPCLNARTMEQSRFVASVQSQICRPSRKESMVAICVVAFDEMVAPEAMPRWDLMGFRSRMHERFEKVSSRALLWAVGGVDISLNVDQRNASKVERQGPHFQPHLHLIGETSNRTQLTRELAALFPRHDRLCQWPVHVQAFDGEEQGIRYLLKPNFARRETFSKPDGKPGVRDRQLKTVKEFELQPILIAFQGTTTDNRIFCHGCMLIKEGLFEQERRLEIINPNES